jgi:hypothetical protein
VIVHISAYGPTDTRYFEPGERAEIATEEETLCSYVAAVVPVRVELER